MRNTLLALMVLFALTGCGEEVSDTIEDIAEVIVEDNQIEDTTVTVDSEYTYEGVTLYSKDLSNFSLYGDYGSYSVYNVDSSEYDLANAITTDENGILSVIFTNTYINDEYGSRVKSFYESKKSELSDKYELTNEFDFCTGSDYVCRSDNYAYSLYRGERFLSSFYLDDNGIMIYMAVESAGFNDTKVIINYQAEEYAEL